MEEAGCGNWKQGFGGNVQPNMGGGGITHRGGVSVQIHKADVGPVRRRLASSTMQYQEGMSCVGEAWEVSTEGGGVEPEFSEKVYRTVVQDVLLFGSETWVFLTPIMQRLEGAYVGFLRQATRKRQRG